MPRRKTRKNPRKENGDPNASILADGTDELALKKEAFLRDFDIEVEKRIAAMESEAKSIIREIENMITKQKLFVKKDIRSMKLNDFLAKGGDLQILDFKELHDALSNDVSFLESPKNADVTFKIPTSTVQRPITRKRGTVVAQSPLVHDAPLTKTGRMGRATARKTTAQASVSNFTCQPSTTIITPKFDPRLPLTAAREPKKGETLLSLAGSPVQAVSNNSDDTLLSLCLSKQQTFLSGSLFDANMSPNTLMTSRERLQEAIGAINSRLNDLDTRTSKLNETKL